MGGFSGIFTSFVSCRGGQIDCWHKLETKGDCDATERSVSDATERSVSDAVCVGWPDLDCWARVRAGANIWHLKTRMY